MQPERFAFKDIRRISTFRTTISLGIAFALSVALLLAAIYVMTSAELTARSDRILRDESQRLLALPPKDLPKAMEAEHDNDFSYLGLISAAGEKIVGNIDLPQQARIGEPLDLNRPPGGRGPIRLLARRTQFGETIVVGRDISQIRDLSQHILFILLVSGIVIAIGITITGIALSIEPIRRVRMLQKRSSEIASGRLDLRMPIAETHDELDQFASTVNVMIEAVERVVAQVKTVTDAVAHDLRTPLTRVRGNLHRMRRLPEASPELTALADQATADLDTLLDRFSALLRISELEASVQRSGLGRIDLSQLASRACELYEPLAEESGLRILANLPDEVFVVADEKLLFEAVSNLLDNAVKFSPSGGRIDVDVSNDESGARLDIRDTGPGIPVADRDAVLRRFYRGSNAHDLAGSGLGLSIVSAIVHLHGFEMELLEARPGLLVRIRMPVSQ